MWVIMREPPPPRTQMALSKWVHVLKNLRKVDMVPIACCADTAMAKVSQGFLGVKGHNRIIHGASTGSFRKTSYSWIFLR